jgi:sigma-B regulation protein RsbU (phosphoserine phosphatase)
MLAIRYQPKPEEDVLREKLELTNNVRQVPELGNFVKSLSTRLGIERDQVDKIRLAVEEAVVNVMSYAYPPQTKGEISVEARSDGKVLRFIITDVGVAFDPTQVLRADTTLPIEERPIGGLGILLMREMMDTINYERVNGKNILTLIKIINH